MESPQVLSVKYKRLVGKSALETFEEIAHFWRHAFGEGKTRNYFRIDDMEMFMKELGPTLRLWGYV